MPMTKVNPRPGTPGANRDAPGKRWGPITGAVPAAHPNEGRAGNEAGLPNGYRGAIACDAGLLSLLAAVRPFQHLGADALNDLLRGATAHCYEAGEQVFREGDAATGYLLVEHGEVEVLRYSHGGEERVFQVFETGRMVAEAAMFMPHGRYPMHARARTKTRLYRLRRDSLLAACRDHSSLAMHMLALLSQALYMQVNKVDWISSSLASERLANFQVEFWRAAL